MTDDELNAQENLTVRILPPRQTGTHINSGFQFFKIESAPTVRQDFQEHGFGVEGPKNQIMKLLLNRVKINDSNRNITKRWYVDYSVFNSKSNLFERKRAYGFINKEKNPEIRYALLLALEQKIKIDITSDPSFQNIASPNTILYYMQQYSNEKWAALKKTSAKTTITTVKYFADFLRDRGFLEKPIAAINKDMVKEFKVFLMGKLKKKVYNQPDQKISNRTINNHMDFLRAFFNYVINNYDNVLYKNPCRGLDRLKSRSEKHVRYTTEMTEAISAFLKEKDSNLLNYCRFVSYGFLRPNEIIALKIGDIDWHHRTITLNAADAKTGKRKTKKMMNLFYDYLVDMGLRNYSPRLFIFTRQGVPGIKKCYPNYFAKRFKKLVKKKFGLSKLHTVYGFRHTFVSELKMNGAPDHEIMKYTGHETLEAFQKYIREIIDMPAEDLSSFITTKF